MKKRVVTTCVVAVVVGSAVMAWKCRSIANKEGGYRRTKQGGKNFTEVPYRPR